MAKTISTRFRSFLPGAGFDSSGSPKQGKTRIVGVISVTSYGGGDGEPLTATDIGLNNIDYVNLRVSDGNKGAMSASVGGGIRAVRQVTYVRSTGHFYLYNIDSDGQLTPIAVAATETVEFDALGDSASDVELL
jgi:hypothetical protein